LERFEAFTFRGSSKPKKSNGIKKRPTAADFMSDSEAEAMSLNGHQSAASETDEDILDINTQHSEASEDDGESVQGMDVDDESDEDDSADEIDEGNSGSEDDSQSESGDDDDKGRRAELRKIMSEEQKSVVATISEAAKADAQKGSAVRQQRKAFDSLLSVRMVMQKALIASNSMAAVDDKESEDSINQPYEAAEEAAIKLWNTLEGMRYELSKTANTTTGQKRKREVDVSASSSTIWDRMKKSEVSMIHNRQATLEKWSSKVRGSTSLPLTRRLNPTGPEQSITSLLQDQLATSEHLIKRTKMPRSCAPIQRDQKLVEDPNIYDDGNFYQMLLKELVDQRRVESLTAPAAGNDANNTMQWVAVKEAKTRKNVDTKASKGRKMRFTVHEKLQNFMAPDDRATWEPERIDRFFGTLLGQKMNLVEDEVSDEENDVPEEDEGLMLFRS
jgi:protein AATF/BFR2